MSGFNRRRSATSPIRKYFMPGQQFTVWRHNKTLELTPFTAKPLGFPRFARRSSALNRYADFA